MFKLFVSNLFFMKGNKWIFYDKNFDIFKQQSTVHKTSTSERSSSPSNKFNQLTIDAIKALEVKRRCKRFHCCYCKSEKRKVGPSPTSSNTSVHSDDSAETECIGLDHDGDAARKSGSSNIQVDDKTSDVLKIICESTWPILIQVIIHQVQ